MKRVVTVATTAVLLVLAGCVFAQEYPPDAVSNLDWAQVTHVVAARVEIPQGVRAVVVRARCSVHGIGPVAVEVDLSATDGPNFEIVSRENTE